MDAPLSPTVYNGSSVQEINESSLEPFATESPSAKLIIYLEDENEDLQDKMLASYELFTPTLIIVEVGQDVRSKIIEFYNRQVPGHAVCIMCAIGKLSEITVDLLDASITHKGYFEIQTLQGSFVPNSQEGSEMSGTLSIAFSVGEGRVVGGHVAGPLIAATSVLITVGSFFQNIKKK